MKNISKFSWAEMTSNESGKTSASGAIGVIISLVGAIGFLLGILDKMIFKNSIEILEQSIFVMGIGAGLLGYRKGRDVKRYEPEAEEEPPIN
jgi:tetrahydromethanopterin S-methyltransferase subunit C